MDLGLWGLIAGTGWASGVNLYLVVGLLGGAGRLGLLEVPELLARTDVLIVAVVMYLVEFVADKIPYLDSIWDVAHTVIRPVGAAMIGYALGGESPDTHQLWSGAVSGALALGSHAVKATVRAAINASPEPVSNVIASLTEDGVTVGVVAMAILAPLVAIAVVALLFVAGGALAVSVGRLARRGLRRRHRTTQDGVRTEQRRPDRP